MKQDFEPILKRAEEMKHKRQDRERLDHLIYATAVTLLTHGKFKYAEDAVIKAKALDEEVYGG